IHGSAEAFFDYNNPKGWFINIGVNEPLARRVGARIFKLFDVDGYFMLSPVQLQVGAGWRYKKTWGWKHLNVTLRASSEGGAIVSWHPAHFKGGVRAQGSAELHAYTVSASIS